MLCCLLSYLLHLAEPFTLGNKRKERMNEKFHSSQRKNSMWFVVLRWLCLRLQITFFLSGCLSLSFLFRSARAFLRPTWVLKFHRNLWFFQIIIFNRNHKHFLLWFLAFYDALIFIHSNFSTIKKFKKTFAFYCSHFIFRYSCIRWNKIAYL